ncbi:uncharacterized protein LOC122403162 [Colletes gigas]|uniref:uncharacterized protein LOC122403162 n=1 Tax=Colletes gigas TaxID=935657 RepID=UPI001C9B6868|nr:uncharacterized protein LOC122403162 [Colletes gigas]
MRDEKLIELVRQHSFLYNQEERGYSDSEKKEAAWRDIGKIINLTAKDCKKQWTLLRDCFRRALKKRRDTSSGQASTKIKKWKFEDEMSFLIPYFKERECITSLDIACNLSVEVNDIAQETTDLTSNEISSPNPDNIHAIANKSKNNKKRKSDMASETVMNYAVQNRNIDDSNELFFKSLAATVNKLTPYNQAIAKARTFAIVSELELQELSNKNDYTTETLITTPLPSSSRHLQNPRLRSGDCGGG